MASQLTPHARQQALAASRAIRPEDSASNVSSTRSWSKVHSPAQDDDLPPDDLPLPTIKEGQASGPSTGGPPDQSATVEVKFPPAQQKVAQASSGLPSGPFAAALGASFPPAVPVQWQPVQAQQMQFCAAPPPPPGGPAPAAPAVQAAQNLLAGVNEQFGAKKLRKQRERAAKKGARALRFGQMGGQHNALNNQLPPYLRQVGAGQDERSIIVVDSRDQRISSPFQGWLLDEIIQNAQAAVNVNSDAKLVRSPSTGYHLSLFYMRTLDGRKLIVVGSMTSYSSVPCGRWDSLTGDVLSHKAFQPFRWPIMRDDSSTWLDFKFKVEGGLLLHLELRGYRSDNDMTVQLNYINDALIMDLEDVLFIPSCTVTIFQGWRVCAVSGQLYACSEGGYVVALDYPLCHFEVRVTTTASADSIGLDADRVEFRFMSAADRLDVSCSTLAVPSTWLVVSRVSGPTLIRNAKWCREHFGRIEGPDQVMQLSQLAGIHAHWTATVEASSIEETGPRIGSVSVPSNQSNLHLTCESPLLGMEKKIVPKEAIALQYHDRETEVATMILPPVGGAPVVRPLSQVPEALKSLTGPRAAPNLAVTNVNQSEISLTTPGVAPPRSSSEGKAIFAPRRSLEQRQNEALAHAAVTPEAFCRQVQEAVRPTHAWTSGPKFEEVPDQSGTPRGGPKSFKPGDTVDVWSCTRLKDVPFLLQIWNSAIGCWNDLAMALTPADWSG